MTGGMQAAPKEAAQDRLQQLARPRTEQWERYAAEKEQNEARGLLECSFAPKTGRLPEGAVAVPSGHAMNVWANGLPGVACMHGPSVNAVPTPPAVNEAGSDTCCPNWYAE
jgi:hypothetical protein